MAQTENHGSPGVTPNHRSNCPRIRPWQPWHLAYTKPRSEAVAVAATGTPGLRGLPAAVQNVSSAGLRACWPSAARCFRAMCSSAPAGQGSRSPRCAPPWASAISCALASRRPPSATRCWTRCAPSSSSASRPAPKRSLRSSPAAAWRSATGRSRGSKAWSARSAGQRVTVLLDVLGLQTRVSLPTHHLEVLAA